MKIISSILILITVLLSTKHGLDGLRVNANPEQANMAAEMGLSRGVVTIMSILSIIIATSILFPRTFFIGNLLHAITLLCIMAFSLRSGNIKTAMIEIPFLLIPLVLIYLGHPMKK